MPDRHRHHITASYPTAEEANLAAADLTAFRGPRGVSVEVHHGGSLAVDDAERRLLDHMVTAMIIGIPAGALAGVAFVAIGSVWFGDLSVAGILAIGSVPGAILGILFGGVVGILLGFPAVEHAETEHRAPRHDGTDVVVATIDDRRFHLWATEQAGRRWSIGPLEERARVRMEAAIESTLRAHNGRILEHT